MKRRQLLSGLAGTIGGATAAYSSMTFGIHRDDGSQSRSTQFEDQQFAESRLPFEVTDWKKNSANPVLSPSDSPAWDDSTIYAPSLLRVGNTYHAFYQGSSDSPSNKIGHATSTDLTNWTKDAQKPVLKPGASGAWDSLHVQKPNVIETSNQYVMFYTGHDGGKNQIGRAVSSDLISWAKDDSNPILTPGGSSSWDQDGVQKPEVFYDGGRYHMFYTGRTGTTWKIGHATSTDLRNWKKDDANPVLTHGPESAWDGYDIRPTTITEENGVYHMLYGGSSSHFSWDIGHAASLDLKHWVKNDANPVLTTGTNGSWDDTYVSMPSLLREGRDWHLLYTGYDGDVDRIGHAQLRR